jgi:ABC-type glycerol-3-phosphate transport system permease component
MNFRLDKLGPPRGWPWDWAWNNFVVVFENFEILRSGGKKIGIWRMLLNTILYAGVGSVICSFVPCAMGYVTEKFKYKLSSIITGIVIVMMSLQLVGTYPAEIAVLKELGLYNKIYGTWVQKFSFAGIWLLVYQAAFRGISNDFMDAARVDGASEYSVMFKVMIPLSKNVFFTILLLNFINLWNDYQTPLLYVPDWPTLTFGLWYVTTSLTNVLNVVPLRLAGCIIVMMPILILFLIFKDRIMGGVTLGGIKE